MTAAHRKTQAVTEVEVGPVGRSRSLRMILIIRLTRLKCLLKTWGSYWRLFRYKESWLYLQFRDTSGAMWRLNLRQEERRIVGYCIRPGEKWGSSNRMNGGRYPKKKKKKDLQGWVGKIWCTNWDVENKISRRVGHNDADKTTFVHEKKYLEIKILFSRCLDFFGQWCKVCQSKDPVPVSFSKERHKYPH